MLPNWKKHFKAPEIKAAWFGVRTGTQITGRIRRPNVTSEAEQYRILRLSNEITILNQEKDVKLLHRDDARAAVPPGTAVPGAPRPPRSSV